MPSKILSKIMEDLWIMQKMRSKLFTMNEVTNIIQ